MRHVERAHVLEHRPVVLVVAEAHDTARILPWEQGRERAALPRVGRVHLDDLAAERTLEPRPIQQKLEKPDHLLAAHVGVAEVDGGARRFDLDPRARDSFEHPAGLGVETIESLLLSFTWDRKSAVADKPCPWNMD